MSYVIIEMAGGLFNLVSHGPSSILIFGQPSKTLFKVAYSKVTNFGLQKFRLDYEGTRDLRLTEESTFTFKMKPYADLLMDTYVVVNLPDIWSPICSPSEDTQYKWVGYDFRWIREIGIRMISSIEINCGSTLIQKYTGDYLAATMERDFTSEKKALFKEMSGDVPELNDPANALGRESAYPSAFYTTSSLGAEPSIRGRTLYIPINAWFTLENRCAFPLIALQYNELTITVTLRPIQELFQVRDITDIANLYPYIKPDFNVDLFAMYRFLQTPPAIQTDRASKFYETLGNVQKTWNADVHLLSTYCFLSKEEREQFAREDHVYLVKDLIEYRFKDVIGSKRVKLENSSGMVTSWMWYFQRNDINMRNEWSNYTNWPYRNIPSNCQMANSDLPVTTNVILIPGTPASPGVPSTPPLVLYHGPRQQPNSNDSIGGGYYGENTGIFISGDLARDNQRDIMISLGILFEGDYRENVFEKGVYDYVEKYTRTRSAAPSGLYCYNFCLNTSPFEYQPSGAINLSKFKNIELEVTTYLPQVDPAHSTFTIVCDSLGNTLGVSSKSSSQIYQYSYDMILFEERYNILSFIGGNAGMMYAR